MTINEDTILIDTYPVYKLSITHNGANPVEDLKTILFYFGGMNPKGLSPEYWPRVRERYLNIIKEVFPVCNTSVTLYFFPHGGSDWYPVRATKIVTTLKTYDNIIQESTKHFYIGHSYGGFIALGIFIEGKHSGFFSIYGPSLNYELTYINQWLKRFKSKQINPLAIFCNTNDPCLVGTINAMTMLRQNDIDYQFISKDGKHRYSDYKEQMLSYFCEFKN